MAKVLLLPVGLGLAHTGRLIMIARELHKKGVEVVFGAGADAPEVLQKENLPFFTLPEFDRAIYERKIKKNNFFVYTGKLIKQFVQSELKLLQQIKPDAVVYDLRLTAKISAKIAEIPTVSVANADSTPFYDFSKVKISLHTTPLHYLPQRILTPFYREYGQKLLRRLAPHLIQAIFITEFIRLSPTLLKLGYIPSRDPYQLFLGDLTLICDIPQFRPMKPVPSNVKIVGPIFWDGMKKLPSWHKKIDGKKDIIYVTASGTGDKTIFLRILKYLQKTNFSVVATTGNTLSPEEVKISYPNLYITDYLPGHWIMSKAKLVIFPGGNATAYQALTYGIPAICTPFHLDQEDNTNQLERIGTGILVDPKRNFTRKTLLSSIQRITEEKRFKENAKKISRQIRKYNGARQAAEAIYDKILKSRKIS